jgi:hypothetical protein
VRLHNADYSAAPDSHFSQVVTAQVQPTVYLTDDRDQQNAINAVLHEFSLNVEQARVFQIIADHTFQRGKIQGQLLLGLFGEAGTGKSRVVQAVKAWCKYATCFQPILSHIRNKIYKSLRDPPIARSAACDVARNVPQSC